MTDFTKNKTVYFYDNLQNICTGYIKRRKGDKVIVISGSRGYEMHLDNLYDSTEECLAAKTRQYKNSITCEKDLTKTLFSMLDNALYGYTVETALYNAAAEKAKEMFSLPDNTFKNL